MGRVDCWEGVEARSIMRRRILPFEPAEEGREVARPRKVGCEGTGDRGERKDGPARLGEGESRGVDSGRDEWAGMSGSNSLISPPVPPFGYPLIARACPEAVCAFGIFIAARVGASSSVDGGDRTRCGLGECFPRYLAGMSDGSSKSGAPDLGLSSGE